VGRHGEDTNCVDAPVRSASRGAKLPPSPLLQ